MDIKIKNYIGALVVATLAVFSYAALSYVNTYSKVAEPSSFRSFSVSGEGKVVAIPDVAQFTFSVITEGGTDLGKSQVDNTNLTNQAIAFIKTQGVEAKDIKTQNYSVEPRYQYYRCDRGYSIGGTTEIDSPATPCPPPSIVGYTIRQIVEVKIRNFEKIGAIISGVVENGANSVSQLNFTIDNPSTIENEARKKAIAEAQTKAEGIAKAGGFRLGKLLSIDEGGYYPGPTYNKYGLGGDFATAESVRALPAPAIEPGSQDVLINITLRYEIR